MRKIKAAAVQMSMTNNVSENIRALDKIKELVVKGASTIEIRNKAIEQGYRPLIIDGIKKILNGDTTLDELNRQLIIF